MKKIILFLLFLSKLTQAQIIIREDNMESTATWKGVRVPGTFSSYVGGTSSSVDLPPNELQYLSLDTSYRLLGTGLGSSTPEIDTLLFPNITGLDRSKRYSIKFKLASIAYNPSVNLAAGVDISDTIKLEWSASNGIGWLSEIAIIGNNNSSWGFSGPGNIINKNATLGPTVYTSFITNPIREVNLTLPLNVGQLRIRIPMRVNAIGESFLIEDVQVIEQTVILAVELGDCRLTMLDDKFRLDWVTLSESNSDFFKIDMMRPNGDIEELGTVQAAVNSMSPRTYNFINDVPEGQCYIILREVDLNGHVEDLKIFHIINRLPNNDLSSVNDIYYRVNLLGQQVKDYEIIFNKTKKWFIHAN